MKTRQNILLLTLTVLLFLSGCDRLKPTAAVQELKASGAISTVHLRLAPEIAGKIMKISVAKGDTVNAGDELFRLDDELLKVQREQAVAAIAATELEKLNAQKALNDLKKNADVAAAQAQVTLAKANNALDDAMKKQISVKDRATAENIENARAQYLLAQKSVDAAQKIYDKLADRAEKDPLRAQATVNLNNAKKKRDTARSSLDWLLGFPTDLQIAEREANLALAQAQVDKAQRDYDARRNGPDPEELGLAEARLNNAEAQLARAHAALKELDIRLSKTAVSAPVSGVVLDVPLNAGEMAVAGATVVEIGQLEKVTLTVYIPEDQYGRIRLGQQVKVKVDSFPGKEFMGIVTYISDQAEFTPRNVQTIESRSTTVYAVEISLDNPERALKPGMPADAEFIP